MEEHWKHPRVGVGAFVVRDGQLLLLLRKKAPEAGRWSIPGGKVEWGETLESAVLREIKEEVGIEGEVVRLLCVVNHILPEEEVHWIAPAFLVKIVAGEPSNLEPQSAEEVRWFPLDRLPENMAQMSKDVLPVYLGLLKEGLVT